MNVKNLLPKRLLLAALTCIATTTLVAGPARAGGHGGAGRPATSDVSVEVTQLRQRLLALEDRLEKLEGRDVKVSAFRLSPADRVIRNGVPTAGE